MTGEVMREALNFKRDGVWWRLERLPSMRLERDGLDDCHVMIEKSDGGKCEDGRHYRTLLTMACETGRVIRTNSTLAKAKRIGSLPDRININWLRKEKFLD
jgi:hypothetical protein